MSHFMRSCPSYRSLLLVAGVGVLSFSCQSSYSLYEGIDTGIVSTQAHSYLDSTYTPVPDSLRLRFQAQLRLLQSTALAAGCEPHVEARLELSPGVIHIRFDMHNRCLPERADVHDVDIVISPVHPDTFRLIVEQVDFSGTIPDFTGQIVLNRRVDVRSLPGF